MANDITEDNEVNQTENDTLDDEVVNIDNIEGLERDVSGSILDHAQEDESEPPLTQDDLENINSIENNSSNKNEENTKESIISKIKGNKKLLYLVIGLGSLIILILIFILVTLFKSEPVKEVAPVKKEVTKESNIDVIEPPKYEFKIDHIDVTRVNKKLKILTKYELMGITEEEYIKKQELEAQKKAKEEAELKEKQRVEAEQKAIEEAARIEQEKIAAEQKAIEEAARIEQEKIAAEQKAIEEAQVKESQSSENTSAPEMTALNVDSVVNTNEPQNDTVSMGKSFVKYIQIDTNKKILYKTYLGKLKEVDTRINTCRNQKDFIELLVGPLNDGEDYQAIITELKKKKISNYSKMVEITEEEFNKRCIFN